MATTTAIPSIGRITTLAGLLLAGCGGSAPQPGDVTNAGSMAAVVAVAATLQATTGCSLQGCAYGTYCDEQSKTCVKKKCSDGCPTGTYCNEGFGTCQDLPPIDVQTDEELTGDSPFDPPPVNAPGPRINIQ